jgi:DNA-binding FadR family transcriptional regulator
MRDEILLQRYRSGDRFPSERDLASRFDASRGAVREALSHLDQLGLIRSLPGGARVQPIDSASIGILGPLMRLKQLPDPELVDQFIQTFAAFTSLNIKNAIEKANGAELIQMKGLVVEMISYSDNFEALQPSMREFLELVSGISGNLVVRLIGNDLKAQFVEAMMQSGIKPNMSESSLRCLFNDLQASISRRDSEKASVAFGKHFEELRQATRTAIEQASQNSGRKIA